jgi:two-component system chemotaxis response regulator CheB
VSYDIVLVGTSWGGLAALRTLISALPGDFALPVVCIQHRHRDSSSMLAPILQEHSQLNVCEVDDKARIVGGNVYIAPADYHLLVERGHFSLSVDEPVRYSRPSIDVAFESAANAYGGGVIGVVLTGANADGAYGLRRIFERGGLALVQEPATAESPPMPTAALRAVPEARAMTLAGIARTLASLAGVHAG